MQYEYIVSVCVCMQNALIVSHLYGIFLDINECVNSTCEQNCNNTIGSYDCSCDEGYSLAMDVHSCLGITLIHWL